MLTRTPRTPGLALAMAALVVTLGACAENDYNEPDLAFTQSMVVLHTQSIALADTADERGVSPGVDQLSADITSAREPELRTMLAWLEEWDQSSDPADRDVAGLPTPDDLDALEGLQGDAFERRWLETMDDLAEASVALADEESDRGSFGPPKNLARDIVDSQGAEIERMQELLDATAG